MWIRNDSHMPVILVLPGTVVGQPMPDIMPGDVIEVPDLNEACTSPEECDPSVPHLHRIPDGFSEVTAPEPTPPPATKKEDKAADTPASPED